MSKLYGNYHGFGPINTSLGTTLCVGLLIVGVASGLSTYFHNIFGHIHREKFN